MEAPYATAQEPKGSSAPGVDKPSPSSEKGAEATVKADAAAGIGQETKPLEATGAARAGLSSEEDETLREALDKGKEQMESLVEPGGEEWRCERCGRKNRADHKFCVRCGTQRGRMD